MANLPLTCANSMQTNFPYVRSVLLPETGPASIPDDKFVDHVLKQFPVAHSFAPHDTGEGVIILYPNLASPLLGYHYGVNNNGALVYKGVITTARNFSNDYRFARKISEKLTIKSNTTSAGFALGGTLNAATYSGFLSDLPGLMPETIVGLNSRTVDHVSGVDIYEGVDILMLPQDISPQYEPVGHSVPMTPNAPCGQTGVGSPPRSAATYRADSEVLTNLLIGTGNDPMTNAIDFVSGTEYEHEFGSIRVDVLPYSRTTLDGWFEFWTTSNQDHVSNIGVMAKFTSPSGDVITYNEVSLTTSEMAYFHQEGGQNGGSLEHGFRIPISISFTSHGLRGSQHTMSWEQPATKCTFYFTFKAENNIPAGEMKYCANIGVITSNSLPGTGQTRLTLVGYTNVPRSQTITLSGYSNYELVPDRNLMDNVCLSPPRYDDKEMHFMKMLMAYRDKLNLRTVWAGREYAARRSLHEELALPHQHEIAEAFSFSDVIKFMKEQVLPTAKTVAGITLDVIKVLGPWLAMASDDDYVRPTAFTTKTQTNHPDVSPTPLPTQGLQPGYFSATELRTPITIFPVILAAADDPLRPYSEKLFAVLRGKQELNNDCCDHYAITADGYKLYGYYENYYPLKTGSDITLVAIDQMGVNSIKPSPNQPPVVGRSLDGAVMVNVRLLDPILYRIAITGKMETVNRKLQLQPNCAFVNKHAFTAELSLPLLARADEAEYPAIQLPRMLDIVRRIGHGKPIFRAPISEHLSTRGFAMAADESTFTYLTPEMLNAINDAIAPIMTRRPPTAGFQPSNDLDSDPAYLAAVENLIEAGQTHDRTSAQYQLATVIRWMSNNPSTIGVLAGFLGTDPNGQKLPRLLAYAPPGSSSQSVTLTSTGNPSVSQAEAQYAKAQRLKINAEKTGFFADVGWFVRNNYRGPNQAQIAYYRLHQTPPDPGSQPLELPQTSRWANLAETMAESFPASAEWFQLNLGGPSANQLGYFNATGTIPPAGEKNIPVPTARTPKRPTGRRFITPNQRDVLE